MSIICISNVSCSSGEMVSGASSEMVSGASSEMVSGASSEMVSGASSEMVSGASGGEFALNHRVSTTTHARPYSEFIFYKLPYQQTLHRTNTYAYCYITKITRLAPEREIVALSTH